MPKVHSNFVDTEAQKRYIVMDFIPGTDFPKLLPWLTSTEKTIISKRTK